MKMDCVDGFGLINFNVWFREVAKMLFYLEWHLGKYRQRTSHVGFKYV